MVYFPRTGGGGATASEILSIVPLQRAKNTSVEPPANQGPAPSSGPAHKPIILARPQTSAATGTILKGTDRRTGFIFSTFISAVLYFIELAMADTQVDSGSDISAKVSPTRPPEPRGSADSPVTRILLEAPPPVRASLRSGTGPGRCVCSEQVRRTLSQRRCSCGGVGFLARGSGPGCAFAHCPRGTVRAGSLFIRRLGSPAGVTHAGDQVRGRTPTHGALTRAPLTLPRTLTCVFLKLLRISSCVPAARTRGGRCRSVLDPRNHLHGVRVNG